MELVAVLLGIGFVLALIGGLYALFGLPAVGRRVGSLEREIKGLRSLIRQGPNQEPEADQAAGTRVATDETPGEGTPTPGVAIETTSGASRVPPVIEDGAAVEVPAETSEPVQSGSVPADPAKTIEPPASPDPFEPTGISTKPVGPAAPRIAGKELVAALRDGPPVDSSQERGDRASRGPEGGSGLELLIGTRLMAWVGAVVLLIGVGYFVKHALDNQWIGPMGRTIAGAVFGTALLVAAHLERMRKVGFFAQILAGLGIAVYYVCIYFAFGFYELLGQTEAFAVAALVTLLAIVIALRNNWPSTCILALVGGFLSPALLSTGEARPHALFTYLAILNCIALGCATVRDWRGVSQTAFVGTAILGAAWYHEHYDPSQLWIAVGYLSLFYLLYLVLPLLHGFIHRRPAPVESMALLGSNAFAAFGGNYVLLHESHRGVLAAIVAAQAALVLFCAWLWHVRLAGDRRTTLTMLVQGLALLLVVVPIHFELRFVPVTWAAQAVLLAWVANNYQSIVSRGFSVAALLLSVGGLLYSLPLHSDPFTPVFNKPFATWVFSIVATIAAAQLWAKAERFGEALVDFAWWLGSILACLLLNFEVISYWQRNVGEFDPATQAHLWQSLVVLWSLLPLVMCALARWCQKSPPSFIGLLIVALGFLVSLGSFTAEAPDIRWLFANTGFVVRAGFVFAACLCARHLVRNASTRDAAKGLFVAAALLMLGNVHYDIWMFWEARLPTDPLAEQSRQSSIIALWALLIAAMAKLRGTWSPRHMREVQLGAVVVGCFVFLWSMSDYSDGATPLVLSTKFGARLLFVGAVWLAARAERRELVDAKAGGEVPAYLTYEVIANLALAGLVAYELWLWGRKATGELPFLGEISPGLSQGFISAAWSLQALILIVLGLLHNLKYRRVMGVVLFAVVIGKVFLFDLREVDPLYRIVSFMVTGLLLLVGSYFYSRLGNKAVARKGAEQE